MYNYKNLRYLLPIGLLLAIAGCKAPSIAPSVANIPLPTSYNNNTDTTNVSSLPWRKYFKDPDLVTLLAAALEHNQELATTLKEVEIAQNDIRLRKGALLPTVGLRAGAGIEKVGRYTSQGAGDATTEIEPGHEMPDPLTDFTVAAYAHWEADIWKKLRNSKKAAVDRYLASVEGKNFVLTNLIAEVATSYYELLALDSQLSLVKQNIILQQRGLEIVQAQKEAARATEMAVQKFSAEVRKSESLQYDFEQQIRETENRINLLLGRYPQEIRRSTSAITDLVVADIHSGIPSQLLTNRPDIKQAELELAAAKLDVKAARAEFYPSLGLSATYGLQAFKASYLTKLPESLLYSIAGDLTAPLINRNAIQAEFKNANARQLQALYHYEKTVLTAYLEVSNQLSKIDNLGKSYALKAAQVASLNRSIAVSNDLFQSARADYLEVLLTQRDALEAKLELIETKKAQLNAVVRVYRDLGGGWQ